MFVVIPLGIILIAILVCQIPSVKERLSWRLDMAMTQFRTRLHPIGNIPTPLPLSRSPIVSSETPTMTVIPTMDSSLNATTTTITPTAIPSRTVLDFPEKSFVYEHQDWNNCGPATLSYYLTFYGWQGDQFNIAEVVKPLRNDKNVNVDELVNYVQTQIGWLNAIHRVGGSIQLLKEIIASGTPVMIEEGFRLSEDFWVNDDRWAGHYLLITGYDDSRGVFITQDSFRGPDINVAYPDLEKNWLQFHRAFILVYPNAMERQLRSILGPEWDESANRNHALETTLVETTNPESAAFTWFNYGSDLLFFERYVEASLAFDEAIRIGLPQRMLRYQFGPFIAYFNTNRTDDLISLTGYALNITPNSEEALLWQGWGLYRKGDKLAAMKSFMQALKEHPGYADALFAIAYLNENP
jgi:tetratricopeptide (TPR) repeat protein